MDFSRLPKVELHLHLDCSVSYEAAAEIDPKISRAAFQNRFVAPPKCTDLADYLTRAASGIQLMQTKEALQVVTLDLFRQLAADRVIYAEIRFAPLEHLAQGLSAAAVVQTILDSVAVGQQQTSIVAGVILCTLRHYSASQSLELVRLARQFQGSSVVGIDIAGDEGGFSIDQHIPAFAEADKMGIRRTAHAGEARGADSVWETIRHFQPTRIGHGVRSAEDPALLDYLLEHQLHLEVCPTSNIQTNVYPDLRQHPVDFLYRKGISVGINTDARTISNTTLTKEYQQLHDIFRWGKQEFLDCNLTALEHAFIEESVKSGLRARLIEGFEAQSI